MKLETEKYSIKIYRDTSKIEALDCLDAEEMAHYKQGNCWGVEVLYKEDDTEESIGPFPGDLSEVIGDLAAELGPELKAIVLKLYTNKMEGTNENNRNT